MKNIKPGYMVKLVYEDELFSCESTTTSVVEVSGLTRDRAQFIVDVASLFERQYTDSDSTGRFGSLLAYENLDSAIEQIEKIVQMFRNTYGDGAIPVQFDMVKLLNQEEYFRAEVRLQAYENAIFDLVNGWDGPDGYRFKSLSDYRVLFVPPPGIADVTDEFSVVASVA